VGERIQPDCDSSQATGAPQAERAVTPGIWNALPGFTTVLQD